MSENLGTLWYFSLSFPCQIADRYSCNRAHITPLSWLMLRHENYENMGEIGLLPKLTSLKIVIKETNCLKFIVLFTYA